MYYQHNMPRRNNSERPRIAEIQMPGLVPRVREISGSTETEAGDFNKTLTKRDYVETGLGRRLETQSVNDLLGILGMNEERDSNRYGVTYIAGNDIAKKVNYGRLGHTRFAPHDAVQALFEGLMVEAGTTTERESLTVSCRGFGVKEFGSTALKLVVHLHDVLDEEDEPIMINERLKLMDLLEINQKPSVKPYELITHHADLGIVEGYNLDEARKAIRQVHKRVQQIDVNLLPVGSVTSKLPENWT